MSELTAELIGGTRRRRTRSEWPGKLAEVTDRLVARYGLPRLGNYRDPVKEIFYILLSSKTTDSQYRKTYRALTARFGKLAVLAEGSVADILACIRTGGLANTYYELENAKNSLAARGLRRGRRSLPAGKYPPSV